MKKLSHIKGILFDYGATLDTNGIHWSHVIWQAYQQARIPVREINFREAYVFAEQALGKHNIIQSNDTFKEVLEKKIELQFQYLDENNVLHKNQLQKKGKIAISCLNEVKQNIKFAKPILKELKKRYKIGLLTNFYGNIFTVLHDFGLFDVFNSITESAKEKMRKPNPLIFQKAFRSLNLQANEIIMIGDSFEKDISPSKILGCHTIWLKGRGWSDKTTNISPGIADFIIKDIQEIKSILS